MKERQKKLVIEKDIWEIAKAMKSLTPLQKGEIITAINKMHPDNPADKNINAQ